ncbi:cytochrome c oxidase assembly protein [Paracidobacterium acidisoli]|uniref:Cytochrome c oxidase assembly protein n=1 Tax=Paracidobacterium acidisoli TaxID=2303751 RepID=A0A372IPI9_9BACT|nr:cytochrome c oxidase assembly protein [Paracidobacterium acidisoli]MBT9330960.1 cytochrome c oxidase assembly protein [Paracidobacterium acidisoli]
MQDSVNALFTQWDVPPLVTCALAVTAAIYIAGWIRIRRTRPQQFPAARLAAFLGGILALFVAVASPLDTFSESLLFMHMAQHFVLMSVAPPLIVLGAPVVPMLRGLPRGLIRGVLRPVFRSQVIHRLGSVLVRPRVAWIAMNAAFLLWHIPAAYEFALRSENWHNCEHACFFFTSLMFWWPIIEPWPFRRRGSRWMILPYLLLADFVNTGLSATLCFSGRLFYPSYAAVARPFGLSALNDQIAAGAFMWVCGSTIFLIPAIGITMRLLAPKRRRTASPAWVAGAR